MNRKFIVLGLVMIFLSATTLVFAEDVFVTQAGTKYHKETCRLIKKKDALQQIDKEEAVEDGYEPCRRCFKEELSAADAADDDQLSKVEKVEKVEKKEVQKKVK